MQQYSKKYSFYSIQSIKILFQLQRVDYHQPENHFKDGLNDKETRNCIWLSTKLKFSAQIKFYSKMQCCFT